MARDLYFAYGSNMLAAAMAKIGPDIPVKGVARLRGHRLAFLRESVTWKGGAADVLCSPGYCVYGVLYEVTPEDLARLDKKEGAPRAYGRTKFTVLAGDERLSAYVYSLAAAEDPPAKNPAGENAPEIRPTTEYLAAMLAGAAEHGLPREYRAFLEYLVSEFTAGTRDRGLLLCPTRDRAESKGVPLFRLNSRDRAGLEDGKFGVVAMNGRRALGKVDINDEVPVGRCQADQAIRAVLGADGQLSFGHRVSVAPVSGDVPGWSPVKPRALLLPLHAVSRHDSEKNYCVLHPDQLRVLGVQDGEFVRLFTVPPDKNEKDRSESGPSGPGPGEPGPGESGPGEPGRSESGGKVTAYTLRVFSGATATVSRGGKEVPYPVQAEVCLDADGRSRLGMPRTGWVGSPVLVRPALWKALGGRSLFYGITVLLGIGAFFQLLQALAPHWSSWIDALSSLGVSLVVTVAVSVLDLRGRLRY